MLSARFCTISNSQRLDCPWECLTTGPGRWMWTRGTIYVGFRAPECAVLSVIDAHPDINECAGEAIFNSAIPVLRNLEGCSRQPRVNLRERPLHIQALPGKPGHY